MQGTVSICCFVERGPKLYPTNTRETKQKHILLTVTICVDLFQCGGFSRMEGECEICGQNRVDQRDSILKYKEVISIRTKQISVCMLIF